MPAQHCLAGCCDERNVSPSPYGDGEVKRVTHLFAQQNLHNVPIASLNRIPVEERTRALQELHGGASKEDLAEDHQMVEQRLLELDAQLGATAEPAYLEALAQNAEYVKALRIVFLRADRCQPSRAAHRMMKHFETKRSLYGSHTLGRDITLDDLSPGALEELEKGIVQVLPQKDNAGRALLLHYHDRSDRPLGDAKHWMELYHFWFQIMAQNVSTQRNGFVIVNYGVGYKFVRGQEYRGAMVLSACSMAMVRCVACHICFDHDAMKEFLSSLMTTVIGAKYLMRLQSHFGTHVECLYSLMTFGISADKLPLRLDGTINLQPLHEWIYKNRNNRVDNATAFVVSSQTYGNTATAPLAPQNPISPIPNDDDSTTIAPPRANDVVMGRGRRGDSVAGNLRLRKLLEEYLPLYDNGSAMEKFAFAQIVHQRMTESGARFLVPPKGGKNGGWTEMEDADAVKRISDGFRNLRKKQKRNT